MKKLVFLFLVGLSLLACNNSDDNNNTYNPFLNTPVINLNLNLNLPEYNSLKFPGNSVIITNQGIKGVVVYNINNELYTAFELSDPNHSPSSCSKMAVVTPIATCQCSDQNKYNIITGEHSPEDSSKYPMLQFSAVRSGDVIHISN